MTIMATVREELVADAQDDGPDDLTEASLAVLAKMVVRYHGAGEAGLRAAQGAFDDAQMNRWRCGRVLVEAKRRLGHGPFEEWVEAHCSFTVRSAQRYMNLYRKNDRLSHLVAATSIREVADNLADSAAAAEPTPREVIAFQTVRSSIMRTTDFHRLIHNGLLFASKDVDLLAVNSVRLEFSADQVISVATDRFVLGATRADCSGDPMVVQLVRDAAVEVAKAAANALRSQHPEVRIDRGEDAVTFAFARDESLTVRLVSEEFLPWIQLTELTTPIQPVAFDPAKLAVFAKVAEPYCRMTLAMQGPGKPILINIGDSFFGMLMPVTSLPSLERPSWLPPVVAVSADDDVRERHHSTGDDLCGGSADV